MSRLTIILFLISASVLGQELTGTVLGQIGNEQEPLTGATIQYPDLNIIRVTDQRWSSFPFHYQKGERLLVRFVGYHGLFPGG